MNIFTKLADLEFGNPFVFGAPLGDAAAIDRRLTGLAQLTNGNGFRLYPGKAVRTVNGKTRAERKAERRERADAAVRDYHANLKLAREKAIVGQATYFSPDKIAKLVAEANRTLVKPARKPRAKKVAAEA